LCFIGWLLCEQNWGILDQLRQCSQVSARGLVE
jgi:hypothetical protein